MHWKRIIVATLTAAGALMASAPSANAASPSAPSGGQLATLAGKQINLKQGWDDAQTCVVHSRVLVRCYTTAAEADTALGYQRAQDPLAVQASSEGLVAASVPSCASGWVCLWAAINGGGRRLIFQDDYWQDLRPYGFHNEISSWRNNQGHSDWAWLKDIHSGGPGPSEYLLTDPGQYVANVGAYWNDRADYVEG